MKRSLLIHLASVITLALALGCADERPQLPNHKNGAASGEKYSGQANNAEANQDNSKDVYDSDGKGTTKNSILEFKSSSQDAVDFSFGMATVGFQNEIGSNVTVDRLLYVTNPSSLSTLEKEGLSLLCRDIRLEFGAEILLSWRAHYGLPLKKMMSDLLAKGQSEIFCVLRVKDSRGLRYVAFEPSPVSVTSIQGTSKAERALSLGLLMPLATSISFDQSKLFPVSGEAAILPGVKALASDAISLAPLEDNGVPCWYDTAQSGSVVGNPLVIKKNLFSVKSSQASKVQGFVAVGTGGRILKNCEKVELASTSETIQAQVSCQLYQDIKLEGLEAGCQWELQFANAADPLNTIGVPLKMPTLAFKSIDLKKSDEALSLLPKNPLNPVRSKSSTFTNFNESQLKYAELAFDIWLAVHPKSFVEDFKDYMKMVTLSDTCDAGVGGFARLNSTSFTWCAPNLVVAANNPSRPVFHAILVAHETRHSRGWNHDLDDPKYTPCQGSAASAGVMHAIVSTCKEDYCAVLRNAAVHEYITELNYSLKGDARRFQGQCKEWSNAMGLTDAVITNGK